MLGKRVHGSAPKPRRRRVRTRLVVTSAVVLALAGTTAYAVGANASEPHQRRGHHQKPPATSASSSPTAAASSSPAASASSSPAASASASASSSPASSQAGWVDVDQAKWQQELDQWEAYKPAPVAAGTTRVPEFHTNCTIANKAKDDAIVFPNMPGASHEHWFFGPKNDASMTTDKLLASTSTTCDAPGDNAAYWVPGLQKDGQEVPFKSMRIYYGSRVKDPSTVRPFPPGLVMVQGDAKLQVATPKGAGNQFWCAGSAEIGRSADGNWPKCADGGNLIFQLVFKDCWDGKHIDSPDHKSHMGDPVNGVCQGDYPVAVPDLSFMVNYDSLGGDGLALTSGMASSMHGDFMNGWNSEKLIALVKTCLNQNAKCGTTPTFAGG